MKNVERILLASHNTQGAKAAEYLAINIAAQFKAQIYHLIIVPDFWQWMTGDDWLNNAQTQKEYGDYIEAELEQEIRVHIDRLRKATYRHEVRYDYQLTRGEPDKIMLRQANSGSYDLAIIGSPRPKGVEGLNSKLLTKTLPAQIQIPLLIAPFPNYAKPSR